MDYDYDKPGNIPVIAASLRERLLRTSPAPVDPEPGEPEPVDPAPAPPPPPVSAIMIRRDIAAPTPLGSVGTIALRDGPATGYDLSGDFSSADGAGEYSFGAIDVNNRIRARLFGNGGTDFEVVRIENGASSTIHQGRVPKLTANLNLRWRFMPRVESGQTLFYLALFYGSQLIWETKTYQRGLGGGKFAWRTDHPTPATNIQLSPPVDRFRAGTPYLVSASEFRPRIGISYTTLASEPDPAGIEIRQVDLKTGFPVIDWETAILQAGDNGFDLIAVQPSSFTGSAGQLLQTEVRNKAMPSLNATSTIFYPKPTLFGMNHNPAGTYGGEVIYTDLALTREWRDFGARSGRPDGREQNFRGSLYIDQDYNIIRTGPDGLTMYFTRPDSEDCYVDISWKGDGQCRGFGKGQGIGSRLNITEYVAGTKGADGTWRGSFRVQHNWADACDISCNVVSTNPADPVREISFRQRGNPSAGRISDQFVDRIICNVVRAMDLVNANGMIDGRWAQRSRTTNAGVGKLNGMAIEDIIYFMNAAHRARPKVVKGLWVCIPFGSDIDNAIRIVKAYTTGEGTDNGIGLDPGITLYIELGNEIFNGIFPVRRYAIEQAYNSGRATRGVDGENEARIIEQCFNYIRLMKPITENCDLSRVVRVYAHQHSLFDVNLAVVRGILPYVDAGSSAMYFGDSFNNGSTGPYAFTRDFDVLFPRLNKVMDDIFVDARGIRDKWLSFEKPWIPYEGQQHWIMGYPSDPNYDQAFYEQFQQHPRMFDAMDRFYTKWEREYGDLMVSYNNIGPISAQYGAWAFTPSQASKLAISPKQAALRKHLGLSYVD